MKLTECCYGCLKNLVSQAADLATEEMKIREKAIIQGNRILDANFSYDEVSIAVATKIHNVIKKVTKNPDPYYQLKLKEIEIARKLFNEVFLKYNDGFTGLLKLAAVGNSLDFFKPFGIVQDEMEQSACFIIDDSHRLQQKLGTVNKLLYLADNAGEVFFDLPLIKWLRQFVSVTYVVKAHPVQNDITISDIERAGLIGEIGRIMTTGTATPGVVFAQASKEFIREFEEADIILAKGMGYYESLSELPAEGRVFYCLKAKCQPVADALGVPLSSYVMLMR